VELCLFTRQTKKPSPVRDRPQRRHGSGTHLARVACATSRPNPAHRYTPRNDEARHLAHIAPQSTICSFREDLSTFRVFLARPAEVERRESCYGFLLSELPTALRC